jgi:hypothetical protein
MTLGLNNKRNLIILAVTLAVLGYVVYSNVLSGPEAAPVPARSQQAASEGAEPVIATPSGPAPAARIQTKGNRSTEFRPVLRSKRVEDRIDPMKVDPTLHLEVLAKLREGPADAGGRNLFQFGQAPPPPQTKTAARIAASEPIVIPQPRPPVAQAPAGPPPPPPIPLKYYGVSTTRADGRKTAFFLQGDQILMGAEGDVVGKRYRVVRIGVNSVVVEDTQDKRQQPLPLEDNASFPG